MTISIKQQIAILLLLLNLIYTAFRVTYALLSPDQPPISSLTDLLTGTDPTYSFFAPEVAPEIRISFYLLEESRQSPLPSLAPEGCWRECRLRLHQIFASQWKSAKEEQSQLMDRWAQVYTTRHHFPSGSRIGVQVESFDATWKTLYSRTYEI